MRSVAPQCGQVGPSGQRTDSRYASAASSFCMASAVSLDAGMEVSCHRGGYHAVWVWQGHIRLASAHPFLKGKVVAEACYSSTVASQGAASLCPKGAASSTAKGSGEPCAASIDGC